MVRSISPSKSARQASTASAPGAKPTPTKSPSRSKYLKDYRAKRLLSPVLRIQRKLRLMNHVQVQTMEALADKLLGKRLADPKNPWIK
jgi:hypothetical protein